MEQVINYLKNNFETYLEELKNYIRIPSISTLETHKDQMVECAGFVAKQFEAAGMEKVKIFS
ncbi:MAG: peptidase M20, partial [Bacteroidota bacterium]